ncbi:MAG: hypothetical protein IPG00_01470 [Saprospiraceae bacterium]|nr:hypothetical protein [Saprospiraceae bacterium]
MWSYDIPSEPTAIFGGRLDGQATVVVTLVTKIILPENSVGFWISDQDLILDKDNKHYNYPTANVFARTKHFPYVGFEPNVEVIPSGTLMRVSLARWWCPEDSDLPERCYLQLSGWYGLGKQQAKTDDYEYDDLPI